MFVPQSAITACTHVFPSFRDRSLGDTLDSDGRLSRYCSETPVRSLWNQLGHRHHLMSYCRGRRIMKVMCVILRVLRHTYRGSAGKFATWRASQRTTRTAYERDTRLARPPYALILQSSTGMKASLRKKKKLLSWEIKWLFWNLLSRNSYCLWIFLSFLCYWPLPRSHNFKFNRVRIANCDFIFLKSFNVLTINMPIVSFVTNNELYLRNFHWKISHVFFFKKNSIINNHLDIIDILWVCLEVNHQLDAMEQRRFLIIFLVSIVSRVMDLLPFYLVLSFPPCVMNELCPA